MSSSTVPSFEQTSLKIPSATRGWNLDAWRFMPNSSSKLLPVIIMATGAGLNKRMGLTPYAETFTSNGYACITFDYRHWGASDGTPRDYYHPPSQHEDFRTVIRFCKSQPEFDPDRIILWGFSSGGGHVMCLAAERSLKIHSVIFQNPFTYVPYLIAVSPSIIFLKYLLAALADVFSRAFGFGPVYIPVVAEMGEASILPSPGAKEGVESVLEPGSTGFTNRITGSAFFHIPFYRPRDAGPSITCPALFLIGERDTLIPAIFTLDTVRVVKGAEVVMLSGNHFDAFKGNVD